MKWSQTSFSCLQSVPAAIRSLRLCATDAAAAARMYPDISAQAQRTVGLWLATCAGMVYGAVLIGGLTRSVIHDQHGHSSMNK